MLIKRKTVILLRKDHFLPISLIRKFDQFESVIYLYQFWQDNGEENTQNAAFCTQSKSKVFYSGFAGSSGCSDCPGRPAETILKS